MAAQSYYLQGLSTRQQAKLEATLRTMYRNLSQQSGADVAITDRQSLALIHLISGISRLNSRHFDLQLKQIGFTRTQWLVMAAIGRREGWQQSELAQELNMAKAPLGVVIDELEAGNWVERRVHPTDRRARTLHLTAGCRRRLRSLEDSFERLHTRSLAGVAEDELEMLCAALDSIRTQLKSIAQRSGDELRPSCYWRRWLSSTPGALQCGTWWCRSR